MFILTAVDHLGVFFLDRDNDSGQQLAEDSGALQCLFGKALGHRDDAGVFASLWIKGVGNDDLINQR